MMADDCFRFSDVLGRHLTRAGYTPGQLARLCGIPKATIVNWVSGRVTKPRSWRDLVKLAAVLDLSESEATAVLQSAGHPSIAELLAAASDEQDRDLLSPWAKVVLRRLDQALGSIVKRRIQAEEWKRLHEDCQTISLKLSIVRGVASPDNAEMALYGLETHWRLECSDMIRRFVELEHLPDGAVKQDFMTANQNSSWFRSLQQTAERIDQHVDQCETVEDLRIQMKHIVANLHSLELTSGQILKFLDARLQRTLKELDRDIERARASFSQSKVFLD